MSNTKTHLDILNGGAHNHIWASSTLRFYWSSNFAMKRVHLAIYSSVVWVGIWIVKWIIPFCENRKREFQKGVYQKQILRIWLFFDTDTVDRIPVMTCFMFFCFINPLPRKLFIWKYRFIVGKLNLRSIISSNPCWTLWG